MYGSRKQQYLPYCIFFLHQASVSLITYAAGTDKFYEVNRDKVILMCVCLLCVWCRARANRAAAMQLQLDGSIYNSGPSVSVLLEISVCVYSRLSVYCPCHFLKAGHLSDGQHTRTDTDTQQVRLSVCNGCLYQGPLQQVGKLFKSWLRFIRAVCHAYYCRQMKGDVTHKKTHSTGSQFQIK